MMRFASSSGWADRALSLGGLAFRAAFASSVGLALMALAGAAVRLLPWVLDPEVPARVVIPFARGLGALSVEAALLVGWPLGWALAARRFVETGEARVVQMLGESPARSVARLAPQALLFSTALASVSAGWARDATAPGGVVSELIAEGRSACATVDAPRIYRVPLVRLTWLCAPGLAPRLLGSPPGALSKVSLTASDARVSADLQEVQLADARLAWPGATLHVDALQLRGLPSWGRASSLPALLRAVVQWTAASVSASIAAYVLLRQRIANRWAAVALGTCGPLAALAVLRSLERIEARPAAFAAVAVAGLGTTAAVSWLVCRLLPPVAAAR